MRTAAVVLLTLLFLPALGRELPAQELHDTWFKVVVTARGFALDADAGGEAGKHKDKRVLYAWFGFPGEQAADTEGFWPFPGAYYDVYVWAEIEPGQWALAGSCDLFVPGGRDVLLGQQPGSDIELAVSPPGEGAEPLLVHFVARLRLVLDGEGEVSRARFASLGAVLSGGLDAEGDTTVGRAKVTGASVPESKLPPGVGFEAARAAGG